MFGYATDLRSRTQGRATYTMQFSHYAAVPKQVSDEMVARPIRGHVRTSRSSLHGEEQVVAVGERAEAARASKVFDTLMCTLYVKWT